MKRTRASLLLLMLAIGATLVVPPARLSAQSAREVSAESWPEADPSDVSSIDAVIAALYDVISGPAGEKRDWDRFRSLFVPEARLIPTGRDASGRNRYRPLTPDEYAASSGTSLEEQGFFEIETARTLEEFGPIAHAFSTYDSRRNEADVEPFDRGINSIQLFFDGQRWAVMNIFWSADRDDLPIPARYKTSRP